MRLSTSCEIPKSLDSFGQPVPTVGEPRRTVNTSGVQFRHLADRIVAASVGCDTVPTEVIGRPSVVIVVLTGGDQLAIR